MRELYRTEATPRAEDLLHLHVEYDQELRDQQLAPAWCAHGRANVSGRSWLSDDARIAEFQAERSRQLGEFGALDVVSIVHALSTSSLRGDNWKSLWDCLRSCI